MTKRIALVPYEPGQEPEGMVSDFDPKFFDSNGRGKYPCDEAWMAGAIAAAVKAAKPDPIDAWMESLSERERGMAEALLRARERAHGRKDYATGHDVVIALRKAGAPVDEPESVEDLPPAEERNRRQRAGLCRLCGASRGGASSYWCGDCLGKGTADDYCQNHAAMLAEYLAEDVPELWVSRDESGHLSDYWTKHPTFDANEKLWMPAEGAPHSALPDRLADTLALKPGDCRRVTRDEYERFFKPVLDLPPSERYAALERMVP